MSPNLKTVTTREEIPGGDKGGKSARELRALAEEEEDAKKKKRRRPKKD